MLLSDRDILAAQKDGHISLDPWTPEMVQPASIDVRLDRSSACSTIMPTHTWIRPRTRGR